LNSDHLARVIGFGFMAGFFLYEPLLVSFAGGTIGHYLSNLRVVDDRTNGNISLPKAVARVIIKAVLGWFSFISMAAARRHQAVHDLLTRSTVQIRDPAKALPSHYARERVELSGPGMPSRWRRILVIVAYLLASFVAWVMAIAVLEIAGIIPQVSQACFDDTRQCSDSEEWQLLAYSICILAIMAICVGWGWRGRLWGARTRAQAR